MIAVTAVSNGALKLWRPRVHLIMLGLLEVYQQAARHQTIESRSAKVPAKFCTLFFAVISKNNAEHVC